MRKFTVKEHRGKLILTAVTLASGMTFLAATMLSMALPNIKEYFRAEFSQMQWVYNAYTLALAVLILISGSLGDRLGRKKVFLAGILGFGFGSMLSAFAGSAVQLIFFQAVQGIGAAMMIPGSLALINVCFVKKHRGRAIGVWAGFAGAMSSVGPFLAGWLINEFGWQGVFWFNVPLALIVFLVALRYVPESTAPKKSPLDFAGILLAGVSLLSTSFALIRAASLGWGDVFVVLGIVVGAVFGLIFIKHESTVEAPLVPLKMFSNTLVAGANIATFLIYFAINGVFVFLAFNFQEVQGYSPFEAGLALLPPTVLIALLSGPAGSLADRIGPRKQMIISPLVMALGIILFVNTSPSSEYLTRFLPGLILFGLGIALSISPITKSALNVEERYSGAASGVNNSVSRVAALMAIAVLAFPWALTAYLILTVSASVISYFMICKKPVHMPEPLHHMLHH